MKLTGFVGTGSGKLGSSVFSTVAGVQVVRQYQPRVANPSTTAQVNQRARLKLASQLAAALAPVIVIPRQGLKSSRNLFIKKNMPQIIGNSGQAQVAYENIQLTDGNAGLPGISITRSQENGIVVKLQEAADAAVSRVVYILYKKSDEEQLQYLGSVIQTVPGVDNCYQATFPYTEGELVVWAYGMKDMNSTASAKYGDYFAATGEDIAQLVMSRKISASDYQFTATRGNTLFSGDSESEEAGANEVMVYIGASGPGTVSGTGFVNGRKAVEIGTNVTVVATPNTGATFDGWYARGSETQLSNTAEYTFEAGAGISDLVAMFHSPNGEGGDSE